MKAMTFKITAVLCCVFTLSSTMIVPTSLAYAEETIENNYSIEVSLGTYGINGDTIEVTGQNQYTVIEDNIEYKLEYFIEDNIVKIDNSYYYNDAYQSALFYGDATIKTALDIMEGISPNLALRNEFERINASQIPPTTGYGELFYGGERRNGEMAIGFTVGVLTGLAAFYFKGDVATAREFAETIIQSAISAGLAAVGSSLIYGEAGYSFFQAQHRTEFGAVREQRAPFSEIRGERLYGNYYDVYFWSSRP